MASDTARSYYRRTFPKSVRGKYTVNKVRPHTSRWKPMIRRKLGAAPDKRIELEQRMFPKNMVNGSDIERIVAKQVSIRGYGFGFQETVRSAAFGSEPLKMDISVYNTGFANVVDFEAQGAYWHQDREKDEQRRRAIELEGIPVIFRWEKDLLGDEARMDYVIDQALRGVEMPEP